MATIPGQRAQFTWALNEYNKTDDPTAREKYAKLMAQRISAAPVNGFTVDQVTQKQDYPEAEVAKYLLDTGLTAETGLSEEQAQDKIKQTVDVSVAVHIGEGTGAVYAYGYRCCPDRLKIGSTEIDTVQRIATQIGTSTPDKPVLYIEIKSNTCPSSSVQYTISSRRAARRFWAEVTSGSQRDKRKFYRFTNLSRKSEGEMIEALKFCVNRKRSCSTC